MDSRENIGIHIREVQESDLRRVAQLAEQLGYPTSESDVRNRLAQLMRQSGQNIIFVAVSSDDLVIGWLHAMVHISLITEPRVEVAGLVVDERARGKGVGRQLMDAAESWVRSKGLSVVRLSSQTKRVDAHRFYEGLGYEIKKTSHVLMQHLSSTAERVQ